MNVFERDPIRYTYPLLIFIENIYYFLSCVNLVFCTGLLCYFFNIRMYFDTFFIIRKVFSDIFFTKFLMYQK